MGVNSQQGRYSVNWSLHSHRCNDSVSQGTIDVEETLPPSPKPAVSLNNAMLCLLLSGIGYSSAALAQGYRPLEAVGRMTVAEGFAVSLVASEPLVRQPVCIEFDDRGRLWCIQYLQYPNPAGLKRITVDRYSRTEYDRVPAPPPDGPRGADRITILTDDDGDGLMDRGHDFIDGLNLASGMAFGDGGVYVLNVPYLLFYPDRNRDDVPDSDPEVLLSGFGMQDAHSVANSLTFGPDGWLYGCQGSTVTANIRGIEFQQGIWRYHRPTDRFELFCEGGGNSWGLDFDARGNLFYSTNYGGYVLLHAVQGGYFVKSFAKHGALQNPHAYGYFEHAPHTNFQGGHVTVGGIVYQGDSFPDRFRGTYIGGDLLGHAVHWHEIQPWGATVRTAHGGTLLAANDDWFAPTDLTLGPDGAIYVADWHDARTAHPDPDADWDRSNGRIYRLAAADTPIAPPIDYALLSEAELEHRFAHPNQWHVRRARLELARRRGTTDTPSQPSEAWQDSSQEATALEALWTLMTLDRFDEPLVTRLLESRHAAVRHWALRWISDQRDISETLASRLDDLAEREPEVWVRQQLACTAARLPAAQAIPLVNANVIRDIDVEDPYLPLLWWWAVERHSVSGREPVLERFTRETAWQSQLGRTWLIPRLVRRYAAEGTPGGLASVTRLLEAAPPDGPGDQIWEAMLEGFLQTDRELLAGLRDTAPYQQLATRILQQWRKRPAHPTLTKLAILVGHRPPWAAAVAGAMNGDLDESRRRELLEALTLAAEPALLEPLLAIVSKAPSEHLRGAALRVLALIDHPELPTALIALHQTLSAEATQTQIRDLLLARRPSAREFLLAVDRGDIPAAAVSLEQVRRVALLEDATLDQLVIKHWGRLQAATAGEKLAEVRRLNNDLRAGTGDALEGRRLFDQHCATCHRLFDRGKPVGPDLTTANRHDTEALLVSLVDPSSLIRKEYVSLVVLTKDGRIATGVPVNRDETVLELIDNQGRTVRIHRGEIEAISDSPVSLMPDELYRQFSPQQLRDLFAYLQSDADS